MNCLLLQFRYELLKIQKQYFIGNKELTVPIVLSVIISSHSLHNSLTMPDRPVVALYTLLLSSR
jgi:hypothetical protein